MLNKYLTIPGQNVYRKSFEVFIISFPMRHQNCLFFIRRILPGFQKSWFQLLNSRAVALKDEVLYGM